MVGEDTKDWHNWAMITVWLVIHEQSFVNPEAGVHTKIIEGTWSWPLGIVFVWVLMKESW
jgi:hypothetical protein